MMRLIAWTAAVAAVVGVVIRSQPLALTGLLVLVVLLFALEIKETWKAIRNDRPND